jgi:predicted ATPase/signal transduction histidine kinase
MRIATDGHSRASEGGPISARPILGTADAISAPSQVPEEDGSPPNLSGFDLNLLQSDGDIVVWRASNGRPPGFLAAELAAAPDQEAASVDLLARELALANRLKAAGAVYGLGFGSADGRSMLILRDPGGQPLRSHCGQPWAAEDFLRVGACLFDGLAAVHAQGIVHNNLRPEAILYDNITGAVSLSGFGRAMTVHDVDKTSSASETIQGTFAYMAPEQTGRLDRPIDARSDLYSAGMILYELLVGRTAFQATRPAEWIHCHLARSPVPPSDRLSEIDPILSSIVMKLVAKNPEDRYQTASGAAWDLRQCLAQRKATGSFKVFPIATRDSGKPLSIQTRLYGRRRETKVLQDAYDRVSATGAPDFVVVSGVPGIGKTSLANEVKFHVSRARGRFVSGKREMGRNGAPCAAFSQIFRQCVSFLKDQTHPDADRWRGELLQAVGRQGKLLVDLVPELEEVIGPQPSLTPLPREEEEPRLRAVICEFLRVFATKAHPLVIFLDDMQWLDPVELGLVEHCVLHSGLSHVLWVGARRNNDVLPSDTLQALFARFRSEGRPVVEIALKPLSRAECTHLLSDAMGSRTRTVASLGSLVHQKSGGNPFFIAQFFSSLLEEGLVLFDPLRQSWRWDLARISSKGFTENVLDLTVQRLQRLPPSDRQALQLLSCLGQEARFDTLEILWSDGSGQVHSHLRGADGARVVVARNGAYAFAHDRIQEAAYRTIPDDAKPALHRRLGKQLLAMLSPAQVSERIFEVVKQLNQGIAAAEPGRDLEEIAELNLAAGLRAKKTCAYAAAAEYFATGASALGDAGWGIDPELCWNLWFERAECELLSANVAASSEAIRQLLSREQDKIRRARVYELKLTVELVLGQQSKWMATTRECMDLLGIAFPENLNAAQIRSEIDAIYSRMRGRQISDLVHLPLMTNPEAIAAITLMTYVCRAVYLVDPLLFQFFACRAVALMLRDGICEKGVLFFGAFSLFLGPVFDQYEEGDRFSALAVSLVQKHGLAPARTAANFLRQMAVVWTQPIDYALGCLTTGIQDSHYTGEIVWAYYCREHKLTDSLARGDSLDDVWLEAESLGKLVLKTGFRHLVFIIQSIQAFIRLLRVPEAAGPHDVDPTLDPEHIRGQIPTAVCFYWILQMQVHFLFGRLEKVLECFASAEPVYWGAQCHIQAADFHFFHALALAGLHEKYGPERREWARQQIKTELDYFERLAGLCPSTFASREALIAAELARIDGRNDEAIARYDFAIGCARDAGFVHQEALAYELAAGFYRARGAGIAAALHQESARSRYARWGAAAKVGDLERIQGNPEREGSVPDRTGGGARLADLEFAPILGATQVVSGEIDLHRLVRTLLTTVLEHAGAQRGLLILAQGTEVSMAAEATVLLGAVNVLFRSGPPTAADLPEALLGDVVRLAKTVLLADASREGPYLASAYVKSTGVRSVLCLPLRKQARLVGVLYLENRITAGAFTARRLLASEVIAAQAAISLENARLYGELAAAEAAVRWSERCLAEAQRLSQTGSWWWNPANGNMVWSRESFRLFGYDPNEVRPSLLRFLRRVHPGDRSMVAERLASAREEKRDFEVEHRLISPDLGTLRLRIVGQALVEPGSRLKEFFGFVVDVTEQRRNEERAQGQKEAIRTALRALLEDRNADQFLRHLVLGISKEFQASAVQVWLFDATAPESAPALTLRDGQLIGPAGISIGGPPVRDTTYWSEHDASRGPKVFDLLRTPAENTRLGFLREQGVRTLLVVALIQGDRCLGCFEVHFSQTQRLTSNDLDVAQALVHHATLALTLSRLARRAEQTAVTEERNRFAREIHDTLAQSFAGIALHADSMISARGTVANRSRSLIRIRQLAKTGLDEARRSLQALRPRDLETHTLSEALKAAAAAISAEGDLTARFEEQGHARPLPEEMQGELFRIAQEALTNVRKHAMAKNVAIHLKYSPKHVCLSIRDDGIGISKLPRARAPGGYGLSTMRERAHRIGGALRLEPGERGGTTVQVKVSVVGSSLPKGPSHRPSLGQA